MALRRYDMRTHVTTLVPIVATGLALTLLVVASPLTACVLLLAPVVGYVAATGLPAGERQALLGLLAAAFISRLALITAQLVIGIPVHSDAGVTALAGDEAYYLSRALRTRDLLAGLAATKYDFFVAGDEYGRTSYLWLLTWLQVLFGPTPYAMKALNALVFVAGAALLFRAIRPAFGAVPSFVGLGLLLFLPSLLFASVSLLKESIYFFMAAAFTVSILALARRARAANWRGSVIPLAVAAASLWVLNDLRRGAVVIAVAGIVVAAMIRLLGDSPRRLAGAAALGLVVMVVVLWQPSLRARALDSIAGAARMHAGHVFTVGHSYKLLDDDFYKRPQEPSGWDLKLTTDQAARFLARSAASIIATPWPWQMRSTSELVFMPEQLLWYVLVLALPLGMITGWRLDPDTASLLAGMTLVTAAVLAVTTGNVGTLLRLRGLLVPTMIWISTLGLCAAATWWIARDHGDDAWRRAQAAPAVRS